MRGASAVARGTVASGPVAVATIALGTGALGEVALVGELEKLRTSRAISKGLKQQAVSDYCWRWDSGRERW